MHPSLYSQPTQDNLLVLSDESSDSLPIQVHTSDPPTQQPHSRSHNRSSAVTQDNLILSDESLDFPPIRIGTQPPIVSVTSGPRSRYHPSADPQMPRCS